jgi:hypothetical protein
MVPDADRVLRDLIEREPAVREAWSRQFKLKKDPRVTWIGGYLRQLSLDELPQLFNVLRGHMSLVGPRPLLPEERARYDGAAFALYQRVKIGRRSPASGGQHCMPIYICRSRAVRRDAPVADFGRFRRSASRSSMAAAMCGGQVI